MNKNIILSGAILGAISIILGAFGAHSLKEILTIDQLTSFESGVRYQMYHAIFLLFVGLINFLSDKQRKTLHILTLLGTIMFSGSIYLLATQDLMGMNLKFLWPVTPIGGTLLIIAWIFLCFYTFSQKTDK
ncbi:DUF423 domain-containing protein [Capnocytophaga sp. ARDL2]|uniref:DUF423 domain-containing protein n=1 Tax=Capnocytophaga sp. ARDL2 TaxID=3238809 RepID=UPI003558B6FF